MNPSFNREGPALVRNGYLITPIAPGQKYPVIKGWREKPFTADNPPKGFIDHGIGIVCGKGDHPPYALDIDSMHPGLVADFVQWCSANLGDGLVRVGRAPKTLMLYRASEAGLRKSTGKWFQDGQGILHRLEGLGDGQQFVAYGIHPDTTKPYQWEDLLGGDPLSIPASSLPVITAEQVTHALQKFEELALQHGLQIVEGSENRTGTAKVVGDTDPLMDYTPRSGMTLDDARDLLHHVDNSDYDTWLKVGMCLHFELEASEEALDLWDDWSSTAGNYEGRQDLALRWDGFKDSGGGMVAANWLKKVSREATEAVRRAEKQSAMDEIQEVIQGCPSPIDLLNSVAVKVGKLAYGDAALRAVAEGSLRSRFKDLTGNTILTADVRKALDKGRAALKRGQSKRHPDTEMGNAERMVDRYADQLLFAKDAEQWYRWNGIYWKAIYKSDIKYMALETVRALPDEVAQIKDDQERLLFFDFCKYSQREPMVMHMLGIAEADPRVGVESADLDRNMRLFGVGNGVVNLQTGELLPPDPNYLISTITPVCYDPGATAPLFEATVSDVFNGDTVMVAFIKRLIGYSLLGNPTEQVMAIPYGCGANGKGTVLNTVRDVLGDHAASADAGVFLATGKGAARSGGRPELLALRGKRFVYVGEPDEGSELREGLVKSATGGDTISTRWMYSNAMQKFKMACVVFMPTNHKPIVKGDDYAIWRRLLLIPFTRNFDKDPTAVKDPDRAEKLKAEYPGILAWCIQGALDYQREGLKPPPEVYKAREAYKQDMDLLAEWLDECCDIGKGHQASNSQLWASWSMFARERGEINYIPSMKALGRRLSGRDGLEPVRNVAGMKGRGFRGISVKQVGDFD